MAFKSVKYHLTLWSKAIYEKISHIHPWITWYIRPGHGILCLGSLNFIRYTSHIQVLYKHFKGGWGVWGHAYFAYLREVQNSGKPAYMILARSLMDEKKQDKSLTKSSQVSQIVWRVNVQFFRCWEQWQKRLKRLYSQIL